MFEDSFIANEAHWFTADAVYWVFVRSGVIAGARVAGQMMAALPDAYSSDPSAYAKPELLELYRNLDPLSPAFLESDPKNFRISGAEIRDLRISTRRALWTGPVPNSGSVTLVPRSGRKRRLILLGEQDPNRVQSLLAGAGVPIVRPIS